MKTTNHLSSAECKQLAEHILGFKADTTSAHWLKVELAQMLVDKGNVNALQSDYEAEREIQNSYLTDLSLTYEENL